MTASLTTDLLPAQPDRRGARHAGPPSVRRWPRVGAWLPFLLFGAPALFAVHRYGAPGRDLLAFGGYVTCLIAAPGVLLWRAARQRARSLAEDLGPGLALGYVLEVLGYFAARALGYPLTVVLAPVAVLVTFAAVRRLRPYWRAAADAEPAPVGWLWANAAIAGTLLVWSALYFMRSRGLDYHFNDGDLPFQLALIGELRHHLPPQVPWVQGESLSYHWFAYAEMAATSWVTGIAPHTLLLRLVFLPLLAALPFAISTLARQVTGRWWPGPLAAVITLAGVAPYPYGWQPPAAYILSGLGPVEDGVILRFGLFSSPTQTFAALLGVGLVTVLVDVLRSRDVGWRRWLLLASFVAVVCGAKATYLPMILCGLLLVVAVTLVTQRRWHRPALGAVALVVPGVLFAQFVLFDGASQGMVVQPFSGLGRYGLAASTGLGGFKMSAAPTAGIALAVIAVVTLLAWAMIWGGAGATLIRGYGRDPAHLLLVGIGVAAFSAVLLLNHYGFSQTWFLVAARPYLAVAAAAGLALLLVGGGRRRGWWLVAAVALGAAAAWTVHMLDADVPPLVDTVGQRRVLLDIVLPNLALIAVAAFVGVLAWLAGRRTGALRGLAPALTVAVMVGFSLPPTGVVLARHLQEAAAADFAPAPKTKPLWPTGTRKAARWLRANSHPEDLVATNAHCRFPRQPCDNLHFWFAAFVQRHFLIEGWGYTPTANRIQSETGQQGNHVGYWDRARLAANDAAFHAPGAATVDRLRVQFGVRWLFVDRRDQAVKTRLLSRFATLRYRSGHVAVYQL